MSVKFIDDKEFDIYLKKSFIKDIDFNKKEELEIYFKRLFKILNNKYNIKIEGFYEITVYVDKFYGVILHLEKEELDYYDYFKNQVDMRIMTTDTEFLYLVDDIPLNIIDKIEIINNDDNIYIKIKKKLNDIEMMTLMENSIITYNVL